MAEYFNAKEVLPVELIARVMEHLPEQSRSGALVYFSEDYYTRRNAEIARCFQLYQSDSNFGSHLEIYESLSEQYGLSARQICKIVKEAREQGGRRASPRRRYSGVRVGRSSRRMRVRTAVR
ncbi:MAG: hypothetical protein JSV16_11920 [Candidatus Hydrogenedentota bacterium]|nr:MAG: hypothetical protein JSV16_11920 [Candidatus Hydrogenedentota bacterium]